MKITTNTPELLIIDYRPIVVAILLSGFALVFFSVGLSLLADGQWVGTLFALFGAGMGGLFLYQFARRVQVVFHRPEGWVELRRKNLLRHSKVRHALSEIARAEVEEGPGSDSGATYRVVLVIDHGQSAGRHPVTRVYSSGRGHEKAAKAINDWLEHGR